METLNQFILRSTFKNVLGGINSNAYVEEEGFAHLYVRYGDRYINGVRTKDVLDLANFETKVKGTGLFTRLVERIRATYPEVTIYVESVVNPRLPRKLESMGFKLIPNGYAKDAMVPNSFYLATSANLSSK